MGSALEKAEKATQRAKQSAAKAEKAVEKAREYLRTRKTPEAQARAEKSFQQKQELASQQQSKVKKAESKQQKAKQDDDHLQQLLAPETHRPGEEGGCVTRGMGTGPVCDVLGHNYRENGFKYQSGCPEKDWYNLDFSQEGEARERFNVRLGFAFQMKPPSEDPREPGNSALWWMGKGANFQTPGVPWVWNAHHIVAVGEIKKLELWMRLVLQTANYNIHKGWNILFLPVSYRYAKVFQLPAHPQSGNKAIKFHVNYSQLVKKKVLEVRRFFLKMAEQKGGHSQVSDKDCSGPKGELEDFSQEMRKPLRSIGVESNKAEVHLNLLPDFMKSRPEFVSLLAKG